MGNGGPRATSRVRPSRRSAPRDATKPGSQGRGRSASRTSRAARTRTKRPQCSTEVKGPHPGRRAVGGRQSGARGLSAPTRLVLRPFARGHSHEETHAAFGPRPGGRGGGARGTPRGPRPRGGPGRGRLPGPPAPDGRHPDRGRGVTDPAVLAAMRAVPRHRFVPEALRPMAYDDGPLPIGDGQTISQPLVVAVMTAAVRPKPGMKVLEVGTGSGYQAAVLAACVGEVDSIEVVPALGRRAEALLTRTRLPERPRPGRRRVRRLARARAVRRGRADGRAGEGAEAAAGPAPGGGPAGRPGRPRGPGPRGDHQDGARAGHRGHRRRAVRPHDGQGRRGEVIPDAPESPCPPPRTRFSSGRSPPRGIAP